MARVPVPEDNQAQVLILSRRRCCICYGLHRDVEIKRGQIAHLDRDNTNYDMDNLTFLCLVHHDEYDGTTSQSKGLRGSEVKQYRQLLYDTITAGVLLAGDKRATVATPSISGDILSVFWERARDAKGNPEPRNSNLFVRLKLVNHEDVPCTVDKYWLTLEIGGHERRCLGYPSKAGKLQYHRPPDNAEVETDVYPLTINYQTPLKLALSREGWVTFHIVECDMPNPSAPFWLMQNIKMAVVDSLGTEHIIGHSSVTVFPATVQLAGIPREPEPLIFDGELQVLHIDTHSVLARLYIVNSSDNQRYVRTVTASVEMGGVRSKLKPVDDFRWEGSRTRNMEHGWSRKGDLRSVNYPEPLRPLFPDLSPVALNPGEPRIGWVHFKVSEESHSGPSINLLEALDPDTLLFSIVDSTGKEYPITKTTETKPDGFISLRHAS